MDNKYKFELNDETLDAVSGGMSISAIHSGITSDVASRIASGEIKPSSAEYISDEGTVPRVGVEDFMNQFLASQQNTTDQVSGTQNITLQGILGKE